MQPRKGPCPRTPCFKAWLLPCHLPQGPAQDTGAGWVLVVEQGWLPPAGLRH